MSDVGVQSGGSSERNLIQQAFGQIDATPGHEPTPTIDLPPAHTFEGYEIVRAIHRGGQGAVYLAIQKTTKRRVAIKVLHGGPFAGSTGRARFEREIQILGQLNHPNIVKIHDSGQTSGGEFFYVMDYISGRGLDELARVGEKRPAIPEVLALFARLCEGVNAAHLRGVIHRDLKPQNIRVDAGGEPIVVDFGLAKVGVPDVVEDEESGSAHLMSMTGQFVGSLPWASPEQATGSPGEIDMRSDVYSLGVVLYQLLTGRFPYEVVGNMRDVLDNILKVEPARPSTIRRQINDEVETIVLKCLHKDKDRRYQSAGELARDIRRYLSGEPIEAKRDSGWYVISKTLRRHRGPVAFVGVVAVLILGWAISAGFLLASERDARRAAETAEGEARVAQQGEAEQRRIADANAARVRESFRAFVEDFDGRLKRLRGTTRVREELLALLFSHVEDLEGEGVERDLADGKELLATILAGIHYDPTVGRSAEAPALLEAALGHRRGVIAENGNDARAYADLGRTLAARAGLAHIDKRFDDAVDDFDASQAAYDRALTLAGDGAARTELEEARIGVLRMRGDARRSSVQQKSDALDRLDTLQRAMGEYAQSERYWQARSVGDASWRLLRELGVTRDKIGLTRLETARLRVGQASDDPLADAVERLGRAFDDLNSARDLLRSAGELFGKARRARPLDDQLRRDVMLNRQILGRVWRETGRALEIAEQRGITPPRALQGRRAVQEAGLGAFEEALAAAASLVGYADEAQLREVSETLDLSMIDSVQAWRDVAVALNTVGNARRDLGGFDGSMSAYEVSLSIRRVLAQADPSVRYQSDLVVGLAKLGELALARAERAEGDERNAHLREALSWHERARAKLGEMVDAGEIQEGHGHITAIDGAISEIQGLLDSGG